ncbi:MAG: YidC/Oxa1 family membrane protein insertase [Patescibacteria group bacterium]
MMSLFHNILYQPIFNFFVGLYNVIPGHDVGAVIIIITILVRVIIYPLTSKSIKAQKAVQDLQPKVDAIKKEYANDQQKQAAALMAVYKDNKVNPFASCLPLLIQLPILIALYTVLRDTLMADKFAAELYSFVNNPGTLNAISFGFLDLSHKNYVLAVLAGAATFWQTRMMLAQQPPKNAGTGAKDENMMATMNKQMMYFMPVMTAFICISLPSGLSLYWLFSTLLTIAQQAFLMRGNKKDNTPTDKSNVIEGTVIGK